MKGHVVPKKFYVAIYVILLVLTFATVTASEVNVGEWNIVIAMAIAVTKATLVILFFMHLAYSDRLNWIVVGAGFFWLAIMLVLTLTDYFSRLWFRTF